MDSFAAGLIPGILGRAEHNHRCAHFESQIAVAFCSLHRREVFAGKAVIALGFANAKATIHDAADIYFQVRFVTVFRGYPEFGPKKEALLGTEAQFIKRKEGDVAVAFKHQIDHFVELVEPKWLIRNAPVLIFVLLLAVASGAHHKPPW